MSRLALLALVLTACVTIPTGSAPIPDDPDLALASGDAAAEPDGPWDVAPTLHVGERATGQALAHGRRVYPIWIAGTEAAPVPLDVIATAIGDGDDVRVAVLGPQRGGVRPVLAAGGYAQPRGNIELSLDLTTTGQYLIVVGAFDLARETSFRVQTHCEACDPATTDVLASPKDGALTGTGDRTVHAKLGDAARELAVSVELWASPPAHPAEAHRVASSSSFDLAVPATVRAGDDLRVVVTQVDGTPIDTGVATRFAPEATALVRTDALLYDDAYGVSASGIIGLYEGRAQLSMRSEARHLEITETTVIADRPGMIGNGMNAFDATLQPELAEATPPVDGELLSIGALDGNGTYVRLGCFAYRGETRPCPTIGW
jgi:hypothetical protein